ncbi:MAG TPA: nuclear transport factor 2 family protein [Acidimicrobiales bacterium]|nr:nuclear transport factor 2 family protein [Acidimicrobiales bacterium]
MEDADRWKSTVEIMDLASRYTRSGDTGREADFAELFTANGIFEVGERRSAKGLEQIRDLMADVKRAFSTAPPTFFPARHHVSSLNVRFEEDGRASGRSYFLLVGGWGPDHWGTYRDRYELTPEGWRFSYRRATMEGAVPHSPMTFLLHDGPWPE